MANFGTVDRQKVTANTPTDGGNSKRGMGMLKKKIITAITAVVMVAAIFTAGVYAASDIKLFINGKAIETDIQIVDGSSYVPLRVVSDSLGADVLWDGKTRTITITAKDQLTAAYDAILNFASDKYPETAAHIQSAIANGESAVCTIDREGADENRDNSLRGIPTKDGYDRDEWPMAMCAEGGLGADVAYVEYSDNRGSGSWVGNQLEGYANGTRVLFIVLDVPEQTTQELTPEQTPDPEPTTSEPDEVYYSNCSAVKAAGAAPIHIGDPGYRSGLDRDGDGIACES